MVQGERGAVGSPPPPASRFNAYATSTVQKEPAAQVDVQGLAVQRALRHTDEAQAMTRQRLDLKAGLLAHKGPRPAANAHS